MAPKHVLMALLCIAALTSGLRCAGQQTTKTPDYSKESFLVTSTATHARFTTDGASQKIQTTSVKMLADSGVREWGVLQVPYAADNAHIDVHYVRVHKADGSTVVTSPASVLDLPSDVTRVAPMYSDLRQKQIPVKALGVGDTLEFEFATVEDKPMVPGQFWFTYNFGRSFVVLKEVLEIRVPRDREPKVASADLKPAITEDGAERVYTWTTSNTEPTKPAGTDGEPEKPEKPSVQLSTFATWQLVGEWYGKLAQPQAAVTPQIQAKADALVKDLPAGEARIEALYDFVSTKIRYIGLSFGIGRYQPHSAADVLENEYGDCKDKHTLLAALLKAEGIEAWPVLIPSSMKLDEEIPSPGQFDHLITVIPQGKQYLWLDTTPEVAPYGMLFSNLRDKQALVVPAKSAPLLMKTPANPPFASEDHVLMRGELNNEGTFKGHGEMTLRGDTEVVYRTIFHASAIAKWQDVMQAVSYRLGFGGEVSNVQVDDPDRTRQPFHLSYDYERKKYGDWDNRQITPPMPGIPINLIDEDKKPKSPIQAGWAGTTVYTAELTLPAGSSIEAPTNVDLKTAFAEYHSRYSVAGGKLLAERRLTLLKAEVPVDEWQGYVAFQKEIKNDYNHMISIPSPGAKSAAGNAKDNPEAADLVQKAYLALEEQELNLAEDLLDKARRLNPHEAGLFATYGSAYLMRGKTEEGLDAYRTELKEHPDNLRAGRWFAQMLAKMHRNDDAIATYRIVLKAAPDDVDATSELGRLLVEKQNWKEAQPVLEKAIKLRPDNAQVQLWYGQSCLENGKEADGLAALKSAAETSSDPALLSTIAGTLADAGKALDVAGQTARRALTLIEEQTSGFALKEITNAQMRKMVDLAQIWDRMGWVAFKTGDLPVAEKYAQAAWTLAEEPAAGDHLGQIYEKQGQLKQALDAYQLAQARSYPVVEGLDDRLNALRKRMGPNANVSHPSRNRETDNDRLQKLRMVKFPRTKPVSASADFLILIADGKVSDVRMLGGDPKLEPLADALKQTRFETLFPDAGPERIVRQGILSCSVYDPTCMFLMMLPGDASANSRSPIPIRAGEQKVVQVQQGLAVH